MWNRVSKRFEENERKKRLTILSKRKRVRFMINISLKTKVVFVKEFCVLGRLNTMWNMASAMCLLNVAFALKKIRIENMRGGETYLLAIDTTVGCIYSTTSIVTPMMIAYM